MNAAGPNPLEFIVLLMLGGGFGSPSGVTPTAEDPLTSRVAPADCLFYVSWAGSEAPKASSSNHSERLLAEPEIQKFMSVGQKNLMASVPTGAETEMITRLRSIIEGKPGAVFISEVKLNGNRPPDIKGGGILRLDDKVAELAQIIEQAQQRAPPETLSKERIGNREFWKLQFDDGAPTIYWAAAGNYLIVGLGEGSAADLMMRARQQPPGWLTQLRSRITVPRVSSTVYVNLGAMIQMGLAEANDPGAGQMISALGLDKITTFANVSGVDDKGCVSRSLLGIEGQATGILSLLDAAPLSSADFKGVPSDAPVAAALKLDARQIFDLWMSIGSQLDPRTIQQLTMSLQQMQQQFGVSVQDDILQSLGNTWKVHTTGGNGLINGWTISISLRDRRRLEDAHRKLVDVAEAGLGEAGPGAPKLSRRQVGSTTVHMMTLPVPGVPFAPSWCITDDALLIGMAGPAIDAALAAGGSGATVARAPELAPFLAAGAKPLALAYVDTGTVGRGLLPFAKMGLQMIPKQPGMPPMDTSNLPPAEVVLRHLQPSIAAVQRTDDGLELVMQQTLPGGNVAASAPIAVALLLPAVQAAREAARRMQSSNNLKQIALALHNYHDTYRSFPAGYNADSAGKPLLSWRVHILPFVEQAPLYEEFHLDEAWDSPHNKSLIARIPPIYRSPNSVAEPGMTNYLGIGGTDGIFVRPQAGNKAGVSFAQVLDGTSNTIMTVEAADESAVIWTRPADFAPNAADPTIGLKGMRPGGFLAGFADGSVQFISETVDAAALRGMFTKGGGEAVNR